MILPSCNKQHRALDCVSSINVGRLAKGWCVSHDSVSLYPLHSHFLHTPLSSSNLPWVTGNCLLSLPASTPSQRGPREVNNTISVQQSKGNLDWKVSIAFKNKRDISDLGKSSVQGGLRNEREVKNWSQCKKSDWKERGGVIHLHFKAEEPQTF